MTLPDWILHPWPWYVAGPLIGLTVPILLIIGNKSFGISSSLRHICAACIPSGIPYFNYNWKKEIWNLFFVGGIFFGGVIAINVLGNPEPTIINSKLASDLATYGITDYSGLVPKQLFNWQTLLSIKGIILMVVGGFLVGFGTRYAGGCTSGHSITGISNFQVSSLIATTCFMLGGFITTWLFLPLIFKL